jgi:hypothetical protein
MHGVRAAPLHPQQQLRVDPIEVEGCGIERVVNLVEQLLLVRVVGPSDGLQEIDVAARATGSERFRRVAAPNRCASRP